MIQRNGKTLAGCWRLDECKADGPVGMEFLMNPFALVPKEENADRIVQAFELLREWLDTPYFATSQEWAAWVAEFRPRVEAVVGKD